MWGLLYTRLFCKFVRILWNQSERQNTPLIEAVRVNSLEIATFLVKKKGFNQRLESGTNSANKYCFTCIIAVY